MMTLTRAGGRKMQVSMLAVVSCCFFFSNIDTVNVLARNLIAWCCKHFDTVLIQWKCFYTFKTTLSVRVSAIKHQLKVWNARHYKVINLSSLLKETWFSCYYASLPTFHWLNSAMWAHSDGCIYGKQHSPVSSTESAYVTQQWLRCTPWCVHNNNTAIHPPWMDLFNTTLSEGDLLLVQRFSWE